MTFVFFDILGLRDHSRRFWQVEKLTKKITKYAQNTQRTLQENKAKVPLPTP